MTLEEVDMLEFECALLDYPFAKMCDICVEHNISAWSTENLVHWDDYNVTFDHETLFNILRFRASDLPSQNSQENQAESNQNSEP